MECKKCSSIHAVKAGFVNGEQRYKCKECGCQFVPTRHKGKSENTKAMARLLYLCGLSMRTISKIVKTDVHAVYRWIKEFAKTTYKKSMPASGKVVIELDEMWHYLQSKKIPYGFGRLTVVIPVNLLTGSVEGEILLHLDGFTNV